MNKNQIWVFDNNWFLKQTAKIMFKMQYKTLEEASYNQMAGIGKKWKKILSQIQEFSRE